MIEIRDLSKSFVGRRGQSHITALQNVDLEIHDHEFVTLLGPSGCGKTTLLRCLAGLDHPDSGEILIDGKRVTGPALDKAMVFQNFALLPWLTVAENVSFGLKLRGTPRVMREDVAAQLIADVGLAGFENRLPRELSGGMQQRVGLARALAVKPSLLLMDEPFGALDEQTRRLLQEELLRIWEVRRPTVVFVTHSIDEAILLGDRIVLMSARPGRILKIKTVDLKRPRSEHIDAVEQSAGLLALRGELWSKLREMQVG